MGKLQGKVAIVSGGSRGIGAGISRALAAEGAAVVVNFSANRAAADALVDVIGAEGGRAVAIGGNVSSAADAARLVNETVSHFGRLDILVNNAGGYKFRPAVDFDEALFDEMFNVNVKGLLMVTKAAIKVMGKGGSIINLGSFVSRVAPPQSSVYTATKAAVAGITSVLSRELGPSGIRVNSIDPGIIRTEGTKDAGIQGGDMEHYIVSQTPLGRLGEVDDIAPIAVFLASDDARWVSGENIIASGGMR